MRSLSVALTLCFTLGACHHSKSSDNGDASVGDMSGAVDHDMGSNGDGGSPNPCPTYQSQCNGTCIPTTTDPANCGACGKTCTGSTACWLGQCVASCPFDTTTGLGLTACGNACVDEQTDDANCGTCGHACTGGMHCGNGQCVMGITTTPASGACMGSGPPIQVITPSGNVCSGNLAQTSFTWALCSCGDITINGNLKTDAFDSATGPFTSGGGGGPVGANGTYGGNQITDVGGTLWTSAAGGLDANQSLTTHQDLYVNGPLTCNQDCHVGIDAYVNGSLNINGSLAIAGTLNVPTSTNVPSNVTDKSTVKGAVTINPPCACAANQQVPVAAIVDARQTMNDDASIGLSSSALSNLGSSSRLDLPCGNYYFDSIQTNGSLTIVAHGHTAIYVAGDITTNQDFAVTVDPTGSLDLFVKGTINTNQKFEVGSLAAPALTRVYLGSTSSLNLNQGFLLAGNLYSALGDVIENQTADIYGAIFSKAFNSNQDTIIHYDTAVTTQGADCPTPTPNEDGGTTTTCKSCTDCNNQACNGGTCGACTTNADCCAPLACQNGKCVATIVVQ